MVTHRSIAPLNIGEERNQTFHFALTPLPGRIDFDTNPGHRRRVVDGASDRNDAATRQSMSRPASTRSPSATRGIMTKDMTVNVEGKRVEQSFSATLLPNWATITMTSQPDGRGCFRRRTGNRRDAWRVRDCRRRARAAHETSGLQNVARRASKLSRDRIRRCRPSHSKPPTV